MSGVSMSANRIAQTLTWLGGGEWRELGERHERSMHVIAGVVVLLGAALGWLVSPLAITEATHTPMALTLPLTLAFGLLIGAIARAIASGPTHGWSGFAERAAIAVDEAGRQRDAALVVARCEYNPSPPCPQTHITGVPGAGPETRTAK